MSSVRMYRNESTALIARNTKMMMGSQIVTWASSFVLMIFLPRTLGAVEYGKLYFGISVSGLAWLVLDLGLTMFVVKEVARNRDLVNSLFWNGGVLRALAWTISFGLTMMFVVVSGYDGQTIEIVFVLGLANLFAGLYDLIYRIFVGLERMEYCSIGLVVEKVFLSVVSVTMLFMGFGVLTIAVVMLLSIVLNFIVSIHFLRRLTPITPKDLEPSTWPALLRNGFPFMISIVFAFIYYRIVVMMLSSMTNDAVVGWFGAPFRLFDTLMFFPVILNTAVFPELSRMFHISHDSMHVTSRKLLDLTLTAAMPVAVGMVMLARPIISLLFGIEGYTNSVVVLQVLSLSLLMVYSNFVLNTVLISYNKQKQVSWIAPIATVIAVTVNYFAIGYFQKHYGNGAIGAAITTGVTESFVMAFNIYLLPKGCFGWENIVIALKTLGGGAVMAAAIYLLQMTIASWVVAAIVGCLLYAGMLFVLKVISKRDVQFFINMLSFRKGAL